MIAMRFRESDYAAIKKKAEKVNMNFTEFVTASAMNKGEMRDNRKIKAVLPYGSQQKWNTKARIRNTRTALFTANSSLL